MITPRRPRSVPERPSGGSGLTPHTRDQLEPIDPDMRPNALRPVTNIFLQNDPTDDYDVYAIDHSSDRSEPDWRLYRKVGETQDWSSIHRQYMSHHVLVDSTGREWRIDWRSWLALAESSTVRKVQMDTPYARSVIGAVQEDVYEWPEALRILEAAGPGEEPPEGLVVQPEGLEVHIETNSGVAAGEGRYE